MPGPESRPLTAGEIALARSVFDDAIDYSRVRLVRGKWWPLQPVNAAMAPCGNIHFHPKGNLWSDDFSRGPLWLKAFWIHEMVHVWQTQTRGRFYLPLMRHPFCRYRYTLVPGQPFGRYGIEQQAEIVRDLFLLRHGRPTSNGASLSELERIVPFGPDSQNSGPKDHHLTSS